MKKYRYKRPWGKDIEVLERQGDYVVIRFYGTLMLKKAIGNYPNEHIIINDYKHRLISGGY